MHKSVACRRQEPEARTVLICSPARPELPGSGMGPYRVDVLSMYTPVRSEAAPRGPAAGRQRGLRRGGRLGYGRRTFDTAWMRSGVAT